MPTLTQFKLCPKSRSVRLALAEIGVEATLAEERPWEWRPSFLALNPAGELPVLTPRKRSRAARRLRHFGVLRGAAAEP